MNIEDAKLLAKMLRGVAKEKPLSKVRNIVVIDAMNMFMRSFHIINHIDADGDHIGGLSGFLKSVGATIRSHNPTEVYIVFDGQGGSSTKRNLFPEYKAHRAHSKISNPMLFKSKEIERESILDQAVRCIGYCKLLPVKVLAIDNMEADDVVGALVKKFNQDPTIDSITLVTEDRDYLQLINDRVEVYMPIQKKKANTKMVIDKYLSHPNNFAIYKSMIGDPSDNIPGVKGLGPKTFEKHFSFLKESKHYTLDNIYQYCLDQHNFLNEGNDKPSETIFSKILAFKHQIDINYKLVNLHAIEFTDIDEEEIFRTITETKLEYEPLTFLEMYNADGLGNSIPNTRMWLKEIFEPLKHRSLV